MGKFLDFYRTRLEEVVLEKLWLGEEITDPFELEILEEARQAIEKKTKAKIYWDNGDVAYLYQIPDSLRTEAMQYRYETLIYNTWLHQTAQQYYEEAEGNEKEKLDYAADQMSNHGTIEQVSEWVKGPQDWDFIPLKGNLYFVNTGGNKLVEKLKSLSLDPDFDKHEGKLQWKGYEPPPKSTNKGGTISERINSWEQMSSEGWYTQNYAPHFDFEEHKGLRVLSAELISKVNEKQNQERRPALLRLIAQPEWLAAKGVKVDTRNYDSFVEKMMFGQNQEFRIYPYITKTGEVDSMKSRISTLYPAKEVDQKGLEEYAKAKPEGFAEADLEKLRSQVSGRVSIDRPLSELYQERKDLKERETEVRALPDGNNRKTQKLQKLENLRKLNKENTKKIQIKEILEKHRQSLIDKGATLNPGDYTTLSHRNKEQRKEIIQVLRDNGVFDAGSDEDLRKRRMEIVQNTKTVNPADLDKPENKGFKGTKQTGMWVNWHAAITHEDHNLAERWKKEPVHHNAFLYSEDTGQKFNVFFPWDKHHTEPQKSPAIWGLNRAITGSQSHKTQNNKKYEELKNTKISMLFLDVENEVISNLGQPIFKKYFQAYDNWQAMPSEDTENALRNMYEAAAKEVRTIASRIMGRYREQLDRETQSGTKNNDIEIQNAVAKPTGNKEDKIDAALFAREYDPKKWNMSTQNALAIVKQLVDPISKIREKALVEAKNQTKGHEDELTIRFISILYHLRHYQISNTPKMKEHLKEINLDHLVVQEVLDELKQMKRNLRNPEKLINTPIVKIYISNPQEYKNQKMADVKQDGDQTQIEDNAYIASRTEMQQTITRGLNRLGISMSDYTGTDPYGEVEEKLQLVFGKDFRVVEKQHKPVKLGSLKSFFNKPALSAEPVPVMPAKERQPEPEPAPEPVPVKQRVQRTLF